MTALNQLCCPRSRADAADPASVIKKKNQWKKQAIGKAGETVRESCRGSVVG